MLPAGLPETWREFAATIRPYNPGAAEAYERAAAQLEESLRDSAMEALDLHAAALESGYSVRHLRRLLRQNPKLNAGTKDDPKILRRDLPRKPAATIANARPQRPSLSAQVACGAVVFEDDDA